MNQISELTVDFLVIGGGIAGLRAAIELAAHGSVLVLTKDTPTESSTEYAQGGIAVALSDEDEVGIHYEDTLRAGDGLCRQEAVRVMVEEGPDLIRQLISWGALFDKAEDAFIFTHEAAHTKKRILRAMGDSTGKEIERALIDKARTLAGVTRYDFSFTIDLIVADNRCLGALALRKDRILKIFAKAVVLATGGAGQLFSRTTNPLIATGDGMAIAYRAGAILEDMEFIQFHPTSLYSPYAPHFLLSEAMRGEGGILRNIRGGRFMPDYHKDAELAPRDIVSRAILSELVRTGARHVYLDMTHLDRDFVKNRFPRIWRTCLQYDLDITEDRIPVSPAAHYMMGGVKTDIHGATSIEGLFAAGEVACTGVHGANRLASNSLLEGLVFGARAARACVQYVKQAGRHIHGCPVLTEIKTKQTIRNLEKLRQSLKRVMWNKTGIIRCEKSLSEAHQYFHQWQPVLDGVEVNRPSLELMNMLTVGMLITQAALLRRESVGAHFRSDFPTKAKPIAIGLKKGRDYSSGNYWPEASVHDRRAAP
ncbi:MAG TPA: L-aspartate oxidase [Thermodesulfovibrionia bacterium]|nr:L-aspartate oxidase [Thermodesulfovibrionia bacterium]